MPSYANDTGGFGSTTFPGGAPVATPTPAPNFFQNMASLRMQDPWEVLGNPDSTAMQKFLSVLMSSKVQTNNFGFQGPNADANPMMMKLMSQMMKGDKNSSKTSDASASMVLNKPMNADPLGAIPSSADFIKSLGMGGMSLSARY
jgi:hypothetical protein